MKPYGSSRYNRCRIRRPERKKSLSFFAQIALAFIIFSGILWGLIAWGHIPVAEVFKVLGGGSIATAFAALIAAWVLHYRWMVDRESQEKNENRRIEIEQRRHREQERGKRQEKMGERVAKAVSHIGEGSGYMQVSGLIELAGLVDDWWSLGREMKADSGKEPRNSEEIADIDRLVARRRQELVDLIFKHTLQPDGEVGKDCPTDAEKQRAEMVQEARSQILQLHLGDVDGRSGASDLNYDANEGDWNHLNLSDAYLNNSYLQNKSLEEAKLSKARLKKSRLNNANLRNAQLVHTDLTEADLLRANLTEATLRYANLTGAKLHSADLTGAKLLRANLTGADLFRANLTGAKLHSANLTGAKLLRADLTEATLHSANLAEAKLLRANLTEAKLRYANLTGANLTGADLTGADLTRAQIDTYYEGRPIYSESTIFPAEYDIQQSGFLKRDFRS